MGKLFKICFLCLLMLMVFNLRASAEGVSVKDKNGPPTLNSSISDETGPPKEMTDIFDIKPPTIFGVNPAWAGYALAVLSAVLLLALFYLAYRYWKKKRHPVSPLLPSVSPEEKAYKLLEDLKELMNTSGKEFYFRLSAVFRGYIQDRYGIEALEMTTEELLPGIKKLGIDEQMKMDSRAFMESSDPVKFADLAAETERMETHYRFVRLFIEKTTPIAAVMAQSEIDNPGRR